ncbi:MAG: NAD(P)/FAD-dependent oxidoreductase [Alphaproteobacteria bacterium]|nr:NAD(P)/FAD-dependent oxidoreductase [Alphaproteobacteria bacterium]
MTETKFDALIVGAGFAGLYMLHKLRGMGMSARVLETGSGVGGTWYWNRYPGARCDIGSLEYSYQFSAELQQEWHWSERYAPQPEILDYANHVADRFDLRRDIQFNTRVLSATFNDATNDWTLETSTGDRLTATHCIMATGCLSSANTPDFDGMDSFNGTTYHTGKWPHEGVDFSGLRVGIIGTGSSAIQSIPIIAEQATHLTVFQRTANYAVPAHNGPMDPDIERAIKADYAGFRARNAANRTGTSTVVNMQSALTVSEDDRDQIYEERWEVGGLQFRGAFSDLIFDLDANETAADFVRAKIRASVKDPATAELLSPTNTFGCKRLCVDTDYYATYNRDNVSLVDVSETPVDAITPEGVTVGGERYALDAIVLATGFDAMTGALAKIDIRGAGGTPLTDKWAAGPRTYLGLATAGFPNLFTITGPGSPSVLSNMIPSIEHHVEWIADCVGYMRDNNHATIDPTLESEDAWVEHVNEIANTTLYPTCNSWYLGANVPGKPRVFMPYIGVPPYVEKCAKVANNGYEGFSFS